MEWYDLLLWEQLLNQVDDTDHPGSTKVSSEIRNVLKNSYSTFDTSLKDVVNRQVRSTLDRVKHINEKDKIYRYKRCTDNLVLLTQYYVTSNESRDEEILCSIKNNIENDSIDKICIFTSEDVDTCEKLFDNEKVEIVPIPDRLTYKNVFEYVYETQDNNSGFLLCNSDCYFDDTVKTLKHLKCSGDVMYTMTRCESLEGSYTTGVDPMVETWSMQEFQTCKKIVGEPRYLEPWSSDAWFFKKDVLYTISKKIGRYNVSLGTNLCELVLQYNLHCQNVSLHNIGFAGFVRCIHNHQTNFRVEDNWKNKPEELIPGIFPCPVYERTVNNSIKDCYRLRGPLNWVDQDTYEHEYSPAFVVLDIEPYVDQGEIQEFEDLTVKPKSKSNMCLTMLGTLQEVSNETMYQCLDCYLNNTTTDYTFDLVICLDGNISEPEYNRFLQYKELEYVDDVHIVTTEIPDIENIYIRPWLVDESHVPDDIPPLGLSNGPNVLFYNSMEKLKSFDYRYILMIETDTIPTTCKWFDICHENANRREGNWLIMSSKYKGNDPNNLNVWHEDYLNGVGIYKNNDQLSNLMKSSEEFVEHIIKTNNFGRFINYDVAHDHYIRTYEPWNVAWMQDCDFIINMSPSHDKDADLDQVLSKYPNCAILHNKRSVYEF